MKKMPPKKNNATTTSATTSTSSSHTPFPPPMSTLSHLVNNIPEDRTWFGLYDLSERLFLSILLFYYCLLTRPLEFLRFSHLYNYQWYGRYPALLLQVCFPIVPFLLALYVIYEEIRSIWKKNWMTDCPGATFFVKPEGVIHNLMWQMWLNIGMYTSIFLIIKDDPQGSETSYQDTAATDKKFWFSKGAKYSARYPKKVCEWDGYKLTMNVHNVGLETPKVMVKLIDSYLGIGDKVCQFVPPAAGNGLVAEVAAAHEPATTSNDPKKNDEEKLTFSTIKELEEIFQSDPKYAGNVGVGTEFVTADSTFGVHQADILTIRRPNGEVEVLRCMYWVKKKKDIISFLF